MPAIHPRAGQPPRPEETFDLAKLVDACHRVAPDPAIHAQRVVFGASGHRGSSLDASFNEAHVLAIAQAVCTYRAGHQIDGPLFMGIDPHALSVPAFESALEVLAANHVEVRIAQDCEYTPTHGGPADTSVTEWIEAKANALLEARLVGVHRFPYLRARHAPTTREHDFITSYVDDLTNVERTREIGLRMAVGARSWDALAQFLAEALARSLGGGLIGIVAANRLAAHFQWPFSIHPEILGITVGFSALVGVVFGLYPARKASRLAPIDALRFE